MAANCFYGATRVGFVESHHPKCYFLVSECVIRSRKRRGQSYCCKARLNAEREEKIPKQDQVRQNHESKQAIVT